MELCDARAARLARDEDPDLLSGFFRNLQASPFAAVLQVAQRFAGKMLGVRPGAEMKAAMEAAEEHGAKLILADIESSKTVARMQRALDIAGFMQRSREVPMPPEVQRVMESLSSQRSLARTVEEIKDRRAVRPVLAYMEKLGPEMVDAILHSRDNHMHEVLQSRVREACRGKGPCVLVVGLAHMDGIERRWAAQNGPASVVALPLPVAKIRYDPTGADRN